MKPKQNKLSSLGINILEGAIDVDRKSKLYSI